MDKPTKPTNLMPRSFGGEKDNWTASMQSSGYEPNVPAVYSGGNLNYQLDCTGKELDYCETICDFINGLPIGKTITTDDNNKLVYADFVKTLPLATSFSVGIVKPDNETIIVDENGVITSKEGKVPFCVNSGSIDANGNGNCLQLPSGSTTIITKNFIQPTLSSNGTWGVSDFAVKWIGSGEGAEGAYIAFDGNLSSSTTSGKHYVNTYLCFYSSQSINVSNINVYMSWMPRTACEILASNDDSTYTSLGTFSNPSNNYWDIPINTNGQEYKYWQIHFTAGGTSDNWSGYINEVTIMATYQEEIVSANNIILDGSIVPVVYANANGTPYVLNNQSNLDISTGYTDGTYNVYASITDGSLSAYKSSLYIQKTEPLGENIATSTNAISSGSYSGQDLSNAFDGNLSSYWGCSQLGSSQINGVAYIGNSNLTSPIKQVRIYQGYPESSLPQSMYCNSFKFQYSNDGTTWNDLNTITGATYQQWQVFDVDDYTPTGATHSFRLLALDFPYSTNSYNWIIGELQLLTLPSENTVWLDKSVRPLKAYKYNNGWQEFTGVPVGMVTISSGAVIACETLPYNWTDKNIVEEQRGQGGYRIYNNGYCEQWGVYNNTSGLKTISLYKSYANKDYLIFIMGFGGASTPDDIYAPATNNGNYSVSQFTFHTQYVYGGKWKTEGYLPRWKTTIILGE